jgi:cobalt-zinc-cadmium efflux system outer membrane protein
VARAAIEQEHAVHELAAARRKLAAMWGESEATFGRIDAHLFALPEIEPFAALVAHIEQSPDYLRFLSASRLRDAEIRLAEARSRSDLSISAGVRRLAATDDNALVFGISMPLGRGARAEAGAAEARAQRAETDAERDAHAVRVAAELFAIHQELQHAITEAETLRSEVVPEMQSALAATRAGYEQGRFSYLEWVDAQRELIAVERALIEAAANAHLFVTEIERLTGEPLAPQDR